MNEVIIKVTNCKNCPFSEYVAKTEKHPHYGNCLAPPKIHSRYDITTYYKNYKSPKWCPLNNNTVTIKK